MIQLAIFVLLLFGYSLVSRRLEKTVLTAPIVFRIARSVPMRRSVERSKHNNDAHWRLRVSHCMLRPWQLP